MKYLPLLLALPVLANPSLAQMELKLRDDKGAIHLVTGVSRTAYVYHEDGKRHSTRVAGSVTALMPSRHWLPGFAKLDKLKATAWTFEGRSSDSYALEYKVRIIPNRDLNDAYMIYLAERPDGSFFKIACYLGKLRKGRSKSATHTLTVPNSYAGTSFRPLLMANGRQIIVSEVDVAVPTPYQKWLEQASEEQKSESDSPAQPLTTIRPANVVGDDGSPLTGTVQVEVKLDESGYVISAKPVKPKNGPLVQSVLDVVYLWEFKPLIKDGKPQECTARIPFNF